MLAANKWLNVQQKFRVRKRNTKYISAQQMLNGELKALYGLIWEWFEKEYPVHMITFDAHSTIKFRGDLDLPLKAPQP